jgi:hypothetical protein
VRPHRANESLRGGGRPERGRGTPENGSASPPRNENNLGASVVER